MAGLEASLTRHFFSHATRNNDEYLEIGQVLSTQRPCQNQAPCNRYRFWICAAANSAGDATELATTHVGEGGYSNLSDRTATERAIHTTILSPPITATGISPASCATFQTFTLAQALRST